MDELLRAVTEVVDNTGFSGAIRVESGDRVDEWAFGLADRAHLVPATVATRFGIASGAKALTALTIMALVERGALTPMTTARQILGADLPLIDDRVTVEQLLTHRSGIGDYLDEDTVGPIEEFYLPVPVHRLSNSESFLPLLDGHPQKFPPGQEFSYCNSGYVVLAVIAARLAGEPFADLVRDRVCGPAAMEGTAFLRSDELPGDAAVGYLANEGLRSNIFHLPVLGSGDGGIYSTVGDVSRLWAAVFQGKIVRSSTVAEMMSPRSTGSPFRYGMGFWLQPDGNGVQLEGCDAGVSFRSVHHTDRSLTWTVVSNTTDGAWPVAKVLAGVLDG